MKLSLEKIQKFSDQPLKKCPNCDKKTLNKLISSPSFRLSGSGWYETDFKTGNKKNILNKEKDNKDLDVTKKKKKNKIKASNEN